MTANAEKVLLYHPYPRNHASSPVCAMSTACNGIAISKAALSLPQNNLFGVVFFHVVFRRP